MSGGPFNSASEPCSIAWKSIEFLPISTLPEARCYARKVNTSNDCISLVNRACSISAPALGFSPSVDQTWPDGLPSRLLSRRLITIIIHGQPDTCNDNLEFWPASRSATRTTTWRGRDSAPLHFCQSSSGKGAASSDARGISAVKIFGN